MTRAGCNAPLELSVLIGYWLGELDESREGAIEEHLIGCGSCSANLDVVVRLVRGIGAAVRQGAVSAVVSDAFLQRLAAEGLRLREYRVPCGGSVQCTVAPGDDFLVARLEAPLTEADRVDMVFVDDEGGVKARLEDIVFDPTARELVYAPRIDAVRALSATTERIQLRTSDRQGERMLAEYTFVHSPWRGT